MKSLIVLLSVLSAALCQDCSVVTPDQLKCMKDEGAKQEKAFQEHCQGVDFELLEKGEASATRQVVPSCNCFLKKDRNLDPRLGRMSCIIMVYVSDCR